MEPRLKRHELEDSVEAQLLGIAGSLIGPGKEDLQAAKDFFPSFFGGLFPALGVAVTRTQGVSEYMDKPDRPGLLVCGVEIYYPSMPYRGAQSRQEDRTGPAKRITRRIRGLFLEELFASPLGAYSTVMDSRGGDRNEVGMSRTDRDRRDPGAQILWIDATELHVST